MWRIGTRGSPLALAQAREVLGLLRSRNAGLGFRLVTVKTAGDEFQGVERFKKSGVGIFTKEIEKRLIAREIDIAVHSLKDLPVELPAGLLLAAVPKRKDVRDVVISKGRLGLKTLPPGAEVGTGSPRRKSQIRLMRPDLVVRDLCGNLNTRAAKVLKHGPLDAIVVARAGILRLGRYSRYARPVPIQQILPAVGQAALALEVRKNDQQAIRVARSVNHSATEKCVTAERSFLKELGGGCRVPVGVGSRLRRGKIHLWAKVFSTQSDAFLSGRFTGAARGAAEAGRSLAKRLLKKGARRFLKEARHGGTAG